MGEETLFHEALAKPPRERAAFLEAACAGQPQLRSAVEALLAAHEGSGSLLDRPPAGRGQTAISEPAAPRPAVTTDYRPQAAPGLVIAGRYTLVEKVGEGGMGEIWVAKQTEPVKRKVALKLIKAGMDSRAVLGRFEQERQALALMDHPSIARVLDGGLTPD
jgi:non-specific serine/threonine protein kinase/serine/threonine-protein kinase